MDLVTQLLKADIGKVKARECEMESKCLSELLGQKSSVKLRALPPERNDEIQEDSFSLDKKGRLKDISISRIKVLTVLDGLVEPSMRDKQLQAHFKAPTPKELLNKLFNAGEIQKMYEKINELSGFGDDDEEESAVEEIKNS